MTKPLFPDDIVWTDSIRERIEELESDHTDDEGIMTDVGLWDESPRREHIGLSEILADIDQDERENIPLIHENYLTQHIKEEWVEIGGEFLEHNPRYARGYPNEKEYVRIPLEDLVRRHPFNCIDWDRAAEECRSDYSIVEIDGTTYYYEAR